MQFSLKYKLLSLSVLLMLSVLGVVGGFAYKHSGALIKDLQDLNESIIHEQLDRIASEVYELCRVTHEFFQNEVEHAFHTFISLTKNVEPGKPRYQEETFKIPFVEGKLSSKKHTWRPVNQTDSLCVLPEVHLPDLLIGETNFSEHGDIFDSFLKKIVSKRNIDITVFQRINASGDMLRIATTLEDRKGEKALGSYMPAYNSQGHPNPIVQDILKKNTYHGRFLLFENWYIAAYKPILSEEGNVLGMLFIGIKNPSLKNLHQAMGRIRMGEAGYVWALYGGGQPYAGRVGEYAITENAPQKGVSPYDSVDANDVYFIREICKEAITLTPYETKSRTIALSRVGEKELTYKRSHYAYFAPWDWVIGAQFAQDAHLYHHYAIREAFELFLTQSLWGIATGCLTLLLLSFILLNFFLSHIKWLNRVCLGFAQSSSSILLEQFGKGTNSYLRSENRSFTLYDEIHNSLSHLKYAAYEIKKQVLFLKSIKEETADNNKNLEAVCHEQKEFLKGLQESSDSLIPRIQGVSIRSRQLVRSVFNFSENLSKINKKLDINSIKIKEMYTTLDHLRAATSTVASRLSVISEKANKLNGVVTTINKVADQAHLLSLNAAIEADKSAGKGSGLSVVDEEVASLSDKTSMATLDTEQIVNEIQLSISIGIKEIDIFIRKLKYDIILIEEMFLEQTALFKAFSHMNDRFFDVVDQLTYQADQITSTVSEANQVGRAVTQTAGLLEDFYSIHYRLKEIQIRLDKQYQAIK